MKRVFVVAAVVVTTALGVQAAAAQTLKSVKDRGSLSCGVSQGLPGFSTPDDKGNWTGIDVDVCRAVALVYCASRLRCRRLEKLCLRLMLRSSVLERSITPRPSVLMPYP